MTPITALPTRHPNRLRSEEWLNNPDDPGMTALYVVRLLNYGLTHKELQSGRPVIGISQTSGEIASCNRVHLETVERAKAGCAMRAAFPLSSLVHPIQTTSGF